MWALTLNPSRNFSLFSSQSKVFKRVANTSKLLSFYSESLLRTHRSLPSCTCMASMSSRLWLQKFTNSSSICWWLCTVKIHSGQWKSRRRAKTSGLIKATLEAVSELLKNVWEPVSKKGMQKSIITSDWLTKCFVCHSRRKSTGSKHITSTTSRKPCLSCKHSKSACSSKSSHSSRS